MKVVERDFNFQDLMNWAFVIVWFWGVNKGSHPWIFRSATLVVFYLFNYRLVLSSGPASLAPGRKASKRLYHLPAFWMLTGLVAYFTYLLINLGWILWVLILCGTLGAGFATFLRLRSSRDMPSYAPTFYS
jgi:hypothetical protein